MRLFVPLQKEDYPYEEIPVVRLAEHVDRSLLIVYTALATLVGIIIFGSVMSGSSLVFYLFAIFVGVGGTRNGWKQRREYMKALKDYERKVNE